jgi:hypothetical protein
MIKNRIAARVLSLFLLMGLYATVQAQDSLKVVAYNLLRYGADGIGGCTPTGVSARNPFFIPIMNALKPDIFGVNEIGPTDAANSPAANILLNILQPINPAYRRATVTFNSGQDVANAMFYNSDKVGLDYQAVVPQSLRNIDYYKFYYKGPGLAFGDTTFIEVVIAHFHSSANNTRLAQAQAIMGYLDAFGRPGNFIVMGDMNMDTYNATPFQAMVAHSNANTKMNDPINLTGTWSNNNNAKHAWSQSTRTSSNNDCGSGGGLDDRFDIILCSNSLMNSSDHIRYTPGSYWVPGNPFAPNRAVSTTVSSSMVPMSDHYPVMVTLEVDRLVAAQEPLPESDLVQVMGQPASGSLRLRVGGDGGLDGATTLQLVDLQGRILLNHTMGPVAAGTRIDLPLDGSDSYRIADGIYLLRLQSEGRIAVVKKVWVQGN